MFSQVFRASSLFWNVLKALATYCLLAELEVIGQFAHLIITEDVAGEEEVDPNAFYSNLPTLTVDQFQVASQFLILTLIKALLLAGLVLHGCRLLKRMGPSTRKIVYEPFWLHCLEYVMFRAGSSLVAFALRGHGSVGLWAVGPMMFCQLAYLVVKWIRGPDGKKR